MDRRYLVAAALFSVLAARPLFAQECQNCKTRKIIRYDIEVLIPRPTTDAAILKWWNYFDTKDGVTQYFPSLDPTRDCLFVLDGGFLTKGENPERRLATGKEHPNMPPPGPAPGGADYLLYGTISGVGAPTLMLKLETASTRELVKSAVIDLPAGFEPYQAGRTVAESLGPIYTRIMEFERKKRDQGEPYAIWPRITLTPARAKLNVNEKTTIDVVLKDCDGVPLANRKVVLAATSGTLDRDSVTTDAQGKASLGFTAGAQPATATITADVVFTLPAGGTASADGIPARIVVVQPFTLPETFAVNFNEKLHSKDMRRQFESNVTVIYVRADRSLSQAYSNIENTLAAAGKVDYIVEAVSGTGRGWNSWDRVWVPGRVSQEETVGKPQATLERTANGMILRLNGFQEVWNAEEPEYMNGWVFDTLDLCTIGFTQAESNRLDAAAREKVVRVPQDLRPTNDPDGEGELVLTFKGAEKASVDIKMRLLMKDKK